MVATACSDTIQLLNFDTNELVHNIKCASNVSSVKWSPDAREIVSTHCGPRNEVKLWQIDALQKNNEKQYWFTKIKEFDECHMAPIFKTCLGGKGEQLLSLASDETISIWKLFEPAQHKKNTKGLGFTDLIR